MEISILALPLIASIISGFFGKFMVAHAIFFYVLSIIAVISAIMVTVSKNTVHSVFF